MKRVLVAGATGYLGKFVVEEFKNRGHFVRALARNPEKLSHYRNDSYLDCRLRSREEAIVG